MRRASLALAFCALGAHADSAWQVSGADVRVTCPLTVGGSFEARSPALSGTLTPGAPQLSGELVADLARLDTGIGLRNEHLRDTYLEVGRGPDFAMARLSEIHLAATDLATFHGRTTFTGTLHLHGVAKPVAGSAEIQREAGTIRVRASFPVRLSEFGIAEPRYLGVGVKDEVQVGVVFTATETR